ncbi:serine/arginine repetitive matrix protein 1 isoform X2 [Cephus cinctus]|uniref:Serine/arginine repetitive matrix protein 1 isoform X2 n=1 Tax=Cephus cinctus TaxID=211228 RepID=A0AAJ7BKL6_CEPCN|nr:serine/arginine repetitive matrix protein 1 isoform X2 [Cephus cinctus]
MSSAPFEDSKTPLKSEEENLAHHKAVQQDVKDAIETLTLPKTNDDVQRAIDGLKDIPDEDLQEFLDDEDFMKGLDVVDAWEGEEDRHQVTTKQSNSRAKNREHRKTSRSSNNRDKEKIKREEKKLDEVRRDPSKSTKDIEKDKMRTKKDSESKILAEKEKAIKHLLDSENVVPPGTEAEAIQNIADKQNLERTNPRVARNKERRRSTERHKVSPYRRKSSDRIRISPHRRRTPGVFSPDRRRSPLKISSERRRSPIRISTEKRRSPLKLNTDHRTSHRSPLLISPDRRRSPRKHSPDRLRRLSWERRTSTDRRWSSERRRRCGDANERDLKLSSRRSRSRDRHRSRSTDRHRSRYSRSPGGHRFSPRRRSHSHNRSPDRRRKRSPFINEITRQFGNEGIIPPGQMNPGFMQPPMPGLPTLIGAPVYSDQDPGRPPYMHHPGPPGMPIQGGHPNFMSFEQHPPGPMLFDPMPILQPPQPDYAAGPVMYNQPTPGPMQPMLRPSLLPLPVPSPQPVPPPGSGDQPNMVFNQHCMPTLQQPPGFQPLEASRHSNSPPRSSTSHNYKDPRSTAPYNGLRTSQDRLKTPEPPVISNSKPFEKTSLSSLLEASVSAKDSTGVPVLYPGFKPEILRHCENALRDLPSEDPRLKMKGRFFFDPKQDDQQSDQEEHASNSILLRRGRNKIYWDEEEELQHAYSKKVGHQMHQKICQTEDVETGTKFVQATVTMVDFGVQVYPYDLHQPVQEEKRPIMDRLDWNTRETFDYTPKIREADDLRWSLSNSSQKRPWTRNSSPSGRSNDRDISPMDNPVCSSDHGSRSMGSPVRGRDHFLTHRGSRHDHYSRDSFTTYRRSMEDHDDFHESRSEHSRGESPMAMDDSGEEIELEQDGYQRGSDWRGRGFVSRGKQNMYKARGNPRGKYLGGRSPFRGSRGGFRGKF